MRFARTRAKASLAAVLILICLCCQADTTLVYRSDSPADMPQDMLIGAGKMRINSAAGDDWMLFDRERNTLYIVDDGKREFYRIDQQKVTELGQALGSLNAQLEAALAGLPAEQRDAARSMMQGMLAGSGGALPEVEIRTTDNTDTVAGLTCRVHETWVDGRQRNTVCITAVEDLDLGNAEIGTLQAMAAFLRSMMEQLREQAGGFIPTELAVDDFSRMLDAGLPVRIHDLQDDIRSELTRIDHGEIDAAAFIIPPDYAEQQIDFGG